MSIRALGIMFGAGLALTACVDGSKDSGDTTDTTDATDTTDTTDATDTTDTTGSDGFTTVAGNMITANWPAKSSADLIDQWVGSGTMNSCSGCLYNFDVSLDGVNTGANISTTVDIQPIDGYPGYGYIYAGSDWWGVAVDYYDYVFFGNYGVYSYFGTSKAPYLYQGYFYFYE